MTEPVAILLPLDVVERIVDVARQHAWADPDKEALAIAEREIAQVKEMVGKRDG